MNLATAITGVMAAGMKGAETRAAGARATGTKVAGATITGMKAAVMRDAEAEMMKGAEAAINGSIRRVSLFGDALVRSW